jgi:UDP-sulfoquinovose synthase
MKVLVLGGDGYLGWPTSLRLANEGHQVRIIDNLIKREIEIKHGVKPLNKILTLHDRVKHWNANQNNKKIDFTICDVLNYKVLSETIENFMPEAIIHYAEQPSAPYSMADRENAVFTQNNNIIGTLNLLFAMKKHCPNAHLIKLGTMGEYGTPNIDIEEGWLNLEYKGRKDRVLYPKKPNSFYHLSKVHDSANIEFACRVWDLRCTDLNQGIVYGLLTEEIKQDIENLSTSFHYDSIFGTIINRFITQVVTNQSMTVYGKGTQKRAYLNINDTINCVNLAMINSPKAGEFRVFNQFTEFASLNDLAEKIKNYTLKINLKPNIKNIKNPRIEEENHYYNPKNTSLISLGLKPIHFDDEQIKIMVDFITKLKSRVDLSLLEPKIFWKN